MLNKELHNGGYVPGEHPELTDEDWEQVSTDFDRILEEERLEKLNVQFNHSYDINEPDIHSIWGNDDSVIPSGELVSKTTEEIIQIQIKIQVEHSQKPTLRGLGGKSLT